MCGRFSFVTSIEKIKQQFGDIETGNNLRLNFNIAPTQYAYVITDQRKQQLDYLRWGLIPYWSKDDKNAGRLINARSEGISSKPSFRVPLRKRRCLVLADSFYEWRKEGKQKIPYRIFPKNDNLLVMAGIWDIWQSQGQELKTFSIITAPPNQEMTPVHNRMPIVFNNKEEWERWLEPLQLGDIMEMLHPPVDGLLAMYRVSEKVNSVRNNSPELHQKIEEPPTLF